MLGILVTSHQPHFFLYHDLLLSSLNKNKFKSIFVCSNENHEFVETMGRNINTELHYLDSNPGHHDGVYALHSLASDLFDDCDYILHYHADVWFDVKLIENIYEEIKLNNYKIASIPRQWLFDKNAKFIDNKTTPFHTFFTMYEINLFKKCFDMNILEDLKNDSVKNGHPSKQFEPCVYAALDRNGIDFDKDILYTDDVMKLKQRFGDKPVYYNFFNDDSGIFHHDTDAFNSNNIYNK